jgi:membrane protein involved in colicin uptake
LAAPQLQHVPSAAGRASIGAESAGLVAEADDWPAGAVGATARAAAGSALRSGRAAVCADLLPERSEGMGAPASGRRTVADDTSESHSPQNAVTASMGAPHV